MCNDSLSGSLITPLLWMISFQNFPFACLPPEADQSLGTCVCFLLFCFCFFSWSVTEQYYYSSSNKKIVFGIPPEKRELVLSIWLILGVCCCCSLLSIHSLRQLDLKVAVAWGMHSPHCKVSAQGFNQLLFSMLINSLCHHFICTISFGFWKRIIAHTNSL